MMRNYATCLHNVLRVEVAADEDEQAERTKLLASWP